VGVFFFFPFFTPKKIPPRRGGARALAKGALYKMRSEIGAPPLRCPSSRTFSGRLLGIEARTSPASTFNFLGRNRPGREKPIVFKALDQLAAEFHG